MQNTKSKLKMYRVSTDYIDYLRTIDPKIQINENDNSYRVYIGTVITVYGHKYFAPLSSYKSENHDKVNNKSMIKIYGNNSGEKLAVIKLNNMFPVLDSEIENVDFKTEEAKYRRLLEKEYLQINKRDEEIISKATSLYEDVKKGVPFFKNLCVNFSKLEQEYKNFNEGDGGAELELKKVLVGSK